MAIFSHPLAETFPASPETNNESTGNTWWMASMYASVAVGRVPESDRLKAIDGCNDLAMASQHADKGDYQKLLRSARESDTDLVRLIGILNSGIEAKFEAAFLSEPNRGSRS